MANLQVYIVLGLVVVAVQSASINKDSLIVEQKVINILKNVPETSK